jgi:hypothetical protein
MTCRGSELDVEAMQLAVWQVGGKAIGEAVQIPGVACPRREPHILLSFHFHFLVVFFTRLVLSFCPLVVAIVLHSPNKSRAPTIEQTYVVSF